MLLTLLLVLEHFLYNIADHFRSNWIEKGGDVIVVLRRRT